MKHIIMLSSTGYQVESKLESTDQLFFNNLNVGDVFLIEERVQADPFILLTNIMTDEVSLINHRELVDELDRLELHKIGEICYEKK